MKTDLFQSCGHCWVLQSCWHTECNSLVASSFRIWNSSTGIPSPPLALFVVMLPKAHLTSHSRMSDSSYHTRHTIVVIWVMKIFFAQFCVFLPCFFCVFLPMYSCLVCIRLNNSGADKYSWSQTWRKVISRTHPQCYDWFRTPRFREDHVSRGRELLLSLEMQRLASHVRKYYKVLTSALGIASRDKYCVADVTHKFPERRTSVLMSRRETGRTWKP